MFVSFGGTGNVLWTGWDFWFKGFVHKWDSFCMPALERKEGDQLHCRIHVQRCLNWDRCWGPRLEPLPLRSHLSHIPPLESHFFGLFSQFFL